MQDFGTKADNSPPPGGQLSAAEFNNLATENENAVLRSGLTLSGASSTQLAESMFLHSVKSELFQDSGVADAYVATPISGTNGVLLPGDYANLNGSVITFKASSANTGASTLNIGQTTGTLLGIKPIRTQADAILPAGAIAIGQYVQVVYNAAFDSGSGAWELLPWAFNAGRLLRTSVYTRIAGVQNVSVNGGAFTTSGASTFSSLSVATKIIAEGCGGGGGSGATTATGGSNFSLTGGGAGGSYGMGEYAAPVVAAAVVIGTGGAGGVAPGGNGVAGGTTNLGVLLSINGGTASAGSGAQTGNTTSGGAQPVKTVSGANVTSSIGGYGFYGISLTAFIGGQGGASFFGPGGAPAFAAGGAAVGVFGQSPGAGGGGSAAGPSQAAVAGAAGAAGILIIREYA